MRVLVGCEFSQVVTRAFRELGHDAFSCDIVEPEINPDWHIQGNVLDVIKDNWDLAIFHPPCTYLTVTGNKWFKPEYKDRFPTRLKDREEAIAFFLSLTNAPIPRICIENPVGIMSSIYCKPTQIIQPYQFGHPEPKKTCLWLKNLEPLQATSLVEPEYHISKSGKRMASWYFKPSFTKDRQKKRSITFEGIAKAMAQQWGAN